MSCRQSKNVTRSRSLPGYSFAVATSKRVLAETPCSAACASSLLDRFRMEVVTDELRVRERFFHQHGGPAVAAPNIGDRGAALQLFDNAVEGRRPTGHQIIVVSRPEELRDGAEHAPDIVTPRHAAAGLERFLDLVLRSQQRGHQVERAGHVDRAVIDREHHRLLFRKRKFAGRRIIGQIVRVGLLRCPFAQIALVDPRGRGQFGGRHRPFLMRMYVKAERVRPSGPARGSPRHRDRTASARRIDAIWLRPLCPPAPQVKGSHIWARFSVFLDWQQM